jgi:peptidoglycan/xylan/chitin deacetylase (PgdA/CDA1 family)
MGLSGLKALAKWGIGRLGAWHGPTRSALARGLTVFGYHDVSEAPAPFSVDYDLALTTGQFERQLDFLTRTFTVIGLDDLLAGRVPPRAALITFDDGLRGIFQQALPRLARRRLPSTVFMSMAPVSGEPFWPARAVYLSRYVEGFVPFLVRRAGAQAQQAPHLSCTPAIVAAWEREHGDAYLQALPAYTGPYATWEDLEAADRTGLVTFGNHLFRHYSMATLSPEELEGEVQANATALSPLRGSRPVLAVPFGHGCSEAQLCALDAWGMGRVFTSGSRLNLDPSARLLYRLWFVAWHDRPWRWWFQLAMAARAARGHGTRVRAGWDAAGPLRRPPAPVEVMR